MECPVCRELYDAGARRPMALVPCGHSCCETCMAGHRVRQRSTAVVHGTTPTVTCPFCRETVATTVVNRGILDFIDEMKTKETGGTEATAAGDVFGSTSSMCPKHGSEMAWVCPADGCWVVCCAEDLLTHHHGHPRPIRLRDAVTHAATNAGSSLVKASARLLALDNAIKGVRRAYTGREDRLRGLRADIHASAQELIDSVLRRRLALEQEAELVMDRYTQTLERRTHTLLAHKVQLEAHVSDLKALLADDRTDDFFAKHRAVMQGLDEVNAAMVPCLHEAQQAQAPRLHTTLQAYAQGLPSSWRLIYSASQGLDASPASFRPPSSDASTAARSSPPPLPPPHVDHSPPSPTPVIPPQPRLPTVSPDSLPLSSSTPQGPSSTTTNTPAGLLALNRPSSSSSPVSLPPSTETASGPEPPEAPAPSLSMFFHNDGASPHLASRQRAWRPVRTPMPRPSSSPPSRPTTATVIPPFPRHQGSLFRRVLNPARRFLSRRGPASRLLLSHPHEEEKHENDGEAKEDHDDNAPHDEEDEDEEDGQEDWRLELPQSPSGQAQRAALHDILQQQQRSHRLALEAVFQQQGIFPFGAPIHGLPLPPAPQPSHPAPPPAVSEPEGPCERAILTLHNLNASHGSLAYPRGVAVDRERIYVCDWYNHRVVFFSRHDGRFLRVLGDEHGATYASSGFNQPSDACVDGPLLYVADRVNHRVVLLDTASGSYMRHFGISGEPGADSAHLHCPTSVCVDATFLYVADLENNRVVVLHKHDGSFVRAFTSLLPPSPPSDSSPPSTLSVPASQVTRASSPSAPAPSSHTSIEARFEPVRLAVDGQELYVADTLAHRVLILNKDTGAFLHALYAGGDVAFRRPMGVAVSGRFLYVANTDMNRIDVFDKPSRAFLRHVPNRTGVRGLSVDEHGRLYAAVQDDCCVQVFAA